MPLSIVASFSFMLVSSCKHFSISCQEQVTSVGKYSLSRMKKIWSRSQHAVKSNLATTIVYFLLQLQHIIIHRRVSPLACTLIIHRTNGRYQFVILYRHIWFEYPSKFVCSNVSSLGWLKIFTTMSFIKSNLN